jgi:hypothetical protein
MNKYERFYVFYDEADFVRCCGTAKDLVKAGYFGNVYSVHQIASRIRKGERKGFVVIMNYKGEIL